ncbi:MAG: Nif11-like leader peptide family natural product precursor [Deltaproteobacteria bacterium]|nr:MAG: Nif11-like leader peptide family natural product precursor [Deltaproteobacteria bacterium]
MSVQSARDFLKKIKSDQGLQDRLEAAPGLEARQMIIKAAGFDFTLEEYKQVIEELAAAAGKELTPEELNKIAAGLGRRPGTICAPDFRMPPTFPY